MIPNQQRQEHLYHQYVIPIVNDGDWYRGAITQIRQGRSGEFYNHTHTFISSLSADHGEERPIQSERAYIYLECWKYHGGTPEAFLKGMSIGSLYDLVKSLITQQPEQQPEPQKEEPVNPTNNSAVAFETKHYVYGMDVANMTSGQLIEAIKKIEDEIAGLKAVKAKSEHIKKRIAELEGMLAKVVEVLDAK